MSFAEVLAAANELTADERRELARELAEPPADGIPEHLRQFIPPPGTEVAMSPFLHVEGVDWGCVHGSQLWPTPTHAPGEEPVLVRLLRESPETDETDDPVQEVAPQQPTSGMADALQMLFADGKFNYDLMMQWHREGKI